MRSHLLKVVVILTLSEFDREETPGAKPSSNKDLVYDLAAKSVVERRLQCSTHHQKELSTE